MAHIRTKAELNDRELTPAEEQLIEACQLGENCVLGDGSLPPKGTPDPERHVNADVLRYLILGGCTDCQVDGIGVWAAGAHITGSLHLSFTNTHGAVRLLNSRFDERLDMEQTRCKSLELNGSELQGLNAQAINVTGTIALRNINTNATIDLNSAIIGGQLACEGATFNMKDGVALYAQVIQTIGSILLDRIKTFARVSLNSATVGGQVNCNHAHFEVTTGHALTAQDAQISGGLIWRNVTVKSGTLMFANVHTSVLADDKDSWPSGGLIDLEGMTYNGIIGGPIDSKTRLLWLKKCTQ